MKKPPRPWREIANVASKETDPDKLWELVEEIVYAFEGEGKKPVQRAVVKSVNADNSQRTGQL